MSTPRISYREFIALALAAGAFYAHTVGVKLDRRGQSSTEYMLLLCSVVMVTAIAGAFIEKYLPTLTERLIDAILSAAIQLASPY